MTLTQIAFAVIMVLNIAWFSMAFYFFSIRPAIVAKMLVPRGERDSLLFGTVVYALRFLGGMNFAFAFLSLVLLLNPVGFTPVQQGWLALVLKQRGMPGATQLGLSRPMRMIFAVDCVMTVANTALWLMLWRVA